MAEKMSNGLRGEGTALPSLRDWLQQVVREAVPVFG